MTPSPSAQDLLRDLAPQVLGAVIRRFRDFAASEDAVQEALIVAATQWPRDGLPENPRAWLIQVASRRVARLGAVMHVLYLILGLYGLLQRMSDNPMVTLNHAIALAMVHGLAAGLERLDALAEDPRLQGHHRLDAVRAHFLERAGDHEGAIAHYRHAAERTTSTSERDYLLMQAARLSETRK
jgi:predicted RNA polymerase sigma factor